MQTVSWYVKRLQAMSADEIVWRARSAVRDLSDRCRIPLSLHPSVKLRISQARGPAAHQLCSVPTGAWQSLPDGDPAVLWRERLLAGADRIASRRLSWFDLEDIDLGHPIDWNREYAARRATPKGLSTTIDYRDYSVTGDAKVAWEPNRHHQLVVLGRAYRATGREDYADAVVQQIDSWIDQCPFGYGMHWRSPLELAIRVINWTWAIDLIAGSRALTEKFETRFMQSVMLHVWDIARKYSRGSSANNHRIGEACGVLVATCYFRNLPDADALREEAFEILSQEIQAQTYESGATREQAFGYHLFVLQLFLVAGISARRSGQDFAAAFWNRLQRMFAFARGLAEGGPPPFFGDGDDGYVLDLGEGVADAENLTKLEAALFAESTGAGTPSSESAYWLLGPSPREDSRRSAAAQVSRELESRSFEDAGYYLLQWGRSDSADRVSVVFDCGELGFGALAAHGHADALSVMVRAGGLDVLVDPGTYDYFSFPEWRQYFRSTRAHNTVAIDGKDQSDQLGSFLWGRRAAARCLAWYPREGGGKVVGEHDGYASLQDPVTCRRSLQLDRDTRSLTITDEIVSKGPHEAALFFHFADHCEVRAASPGNHLLHVSFPAGSALLRLDSSLTVKLSKGGAAPGSGWMSRGYHRRTAASLVAATMRSPGALTLQTRLEFLELG
jgi:hypothetical protein